MLQKMKEAFVNSYVDEAYRRVLVFRILTLLLAITSLFMAFVNVRTAEWTLAKITLGYGLLCLVNFLLSSRRFSLETWIHVIFALETALMLGIFTLTGMGDGFAVLWNLVIPACTLAIFGIGRGTLFNAVTLSMILFLFWCPTGRALLQYDYGTTFMMRFPILYLCLYAISFYVETIRRQMYTRLKETEKSYKYMYRHDALTKLYSRHVFYEEAAIACRTAPELPIGILLFDIDDFKRINDSHGHNIGDAVLCQIADVIRASICEHCMACRWGGEEFLVMTKCTHDTRMVAEQIRQRAADAVLLKPDGSQVSFTVSVGVAVGMADSVEEIAELINRADQAMYVAKRTGKNRVVVDSDSACP